MAMRLIWLALPALALAAAGCGGFTKAGGTSRHTVVLTIANHETGDRDLKEYISAVSRLSDGSITFKLEGGWRAQDIDYDRGTVADVRAGKVDLAKVAVRSFDELGVDDFQAITAPLLVDGLAPERKLLASRLPNNMLPAIHRLGIEGLAMLPGELRRPFGLTRRLLKPSDYRGAVFGVTPSLLTARTFRALGATPRGYLARELPPFVFDGAELDLVTIERDGYDIEGSSVAANVALWPNLFSVVANRMMLTKLTAAQREILRKAGRAALGAAIARLGNKDRVEADILCRRGRVTFVTATPPQLAALRAAVRPVYAQLELNPQTGSFIREIEAMKRGLPRDRVVPCSEPPPRQNRPFPHATTAVTPLDGIWEMTASRAVAGDVDAGRYRMVLRRGRALAVRPWRNTGTFSVRGDSVFFRFVDGDGVYRWNVFRDTLTLRYIPGRKRGAPNPTFAPWHRVGR
jgi:TRAP-type C4-dicarboxylate transport system substrate-binding protein